MTTTTLTQKGAGAAMLPSLMKLALATRAEFDYPTQLVYLEALSDLPLSLVERSCAKLLRRVQFMPAPAQIREAARELQAEDARDTPHAVRTEPWKFYCKACEDSGWEPMMCTSESRCGRHWCHRQLSDYTHHYVKACDCRVSNPDWQRKRQAEAAQVKAKAERER